MAVDFVHLHNHTEYSLLDGMISVNIKNHNNIAEYAKSLGMDAVAITDHGNMFGAIEFYQCCDKNGIKPIIGSEFYVAPGSRRKHNHPNENCHLILLAKSEEGYNNLIKLSSQSYSDGLYYKPRIDKELLQMYHKDLVCMSACIAGSVPRLILANKLQEAEQEAMFYKELFGADSYFFELQIHGIPEEKKVARSLCEMSKKLRIPLVATNDCHYLRKEDAEIQDIMLCISTKKKVADTDRFKFNGSEFYFKTPEEMASLFREVPKALSNTKFIAEMCNVKLNLPGPVLPKFPVPVAELSSQEIEAKCEERRIANEKETDENKKINSEEELLRLSQEEVYLRKLTSEGIKQRYGEQPSKEVIDRMNEELATICGMKFPGYFLIVWDYIKYAKDHGIWVGPGRGSGAGSIVAYSLGITNIDPLKYDLLFERFLNPDRVSMPDFDVDFCKERREEVLAYVNQKYGVDHVSRIVTFGKMGAKQAVRDAGRVLNVPLADVNVIADLIPDEGKTIAEKLNSPEGKDLKAIYEGDDPAKRNVIRVAMRLEGLARQTGIHACGVVIGKESITKYAPSMIIKDEKEGDIVITQYPGPQLEECGLVKMDFLGLITLTMQRNCVDLIKQTTGVNIDLEKLDLTDQKVYKIFADGDTLAVFQFESPGMQKHLQALKPTCFGDLVAMNALYRPGPMDYIPQFIRRKNGEEPIVYDHPLMERYLKDTYGVTVYQEQVMLQSRALANFTRGQSDSLRKAMGKKKLDVMEKLKVQFHDGCMANEKYISGCKENGTDPEKLIEKIWEDWTKFASYAFNKSHAVCYAYVAFQCGYLKAYYPVHYMAAALTSEIGSPDKIMKYIAYCHNKKIKVLPPNVNYSDCFFTVVEDKIVYPLNAIKGVGDIAAKNIKQVRQEKGKFTSFQEFLQNVDLRVVNKGVIESLIYSGALDDLCKSRKWMIENLENELKNAQNIQNDKKHGQASLFDIGEESGTQQSKKQIDLEDFDYQRKLDLEKEKVGFYISGHPLDPYRRIIKQQTTSNTYILRRMEEDSVQAEHSYRSSMVKMVGFVQSVSYSFTKGGKRWAKIICDDLYGSYEACVFAKSFEKLEQENKMPNKSDVVIIDGSYRNNGGTISVSVNDIQNISGLSKSLQSECHIYLRDGVINYDQLQDMRDKLQNLNGDLTIYFHLHDENAPKGQRVLYVGELKMPRDKEIYSSFQNNYDFIEKIAVV